MQARYGSLVNVYVSAVALFYMFLYLTAEFTSVGNSVALFSDGASGHAAIVGTSVITLVYTAVGGLPVSLVTDQVQGLGVAIFLPNMAMLYS